MKTIKKLLFVICIVLALAYLGYIKINTSKGSLTVNKGKVKKSINKAARIVVKAAQEIEIEEQK